MKRIHNFSAGPAVLPVPVLEATAKAVLEYNDYGMSVMEMSHRSKEIDSMFKETSALVLELMSLSADDYDVLYLGGGASLQFDMIPFNFLKNSADYVNTGTWASRAIKEAKMFGKVNVVGSSEDKNFNYIPKNLTYNADADYVHFTSNNTIFGTRWDKIPEVGNVPLICDMSSDLFSRELDFSKFDMIYAGAQKNIGPSGVTLVVLKKSFLATAKNEGMTMMQYKTHTDNESMYNTPPVIPVLVINEVLKWIKNEGGLKAMEAHNDKKAAFIYDLIDAYPDYFKGTVTDKADRSTMNITFNLPSEELENKFIKEATAQNLSGLKGHRSVGGIRASVYNACPIESAEALATFMKNFMENNK